MNKIFFGIFTAALIFSAAAFSADVEVEGTGKTFEDAKRSAFRQAIERATGMLVISEQEVSGYKMTKNYIGSYSSGWIENYQITDAFQDVNGNYIVYMKAVVRDSKIKSRTAQRNTLSGPTFDGQKQADILDSKINQRNSGDKLISHVMSSYPEFAYIINNGQTEFALGRRREPYVDIDFTIGFSNSWIESFKESLAFSAIDSTQCNTLSMVVADGVGKKSSTAVKNLANNVCGADPDIRVYSKTAGNWFPKADGYYFPDEQTLRAINQKLKPDIGRQYVAVSIELLDGAGAVLDRRCTRVDNSILITYDQPKGAYNYNQMQHLVRPNIMGQNQLNGTFRVHLRTPAEIADVSRIRLGIQEICQ